MVHLYSEVSEREEACWWPLALAQKTSQREREGASQQSQPQAKKVRERGTMMLVLAMAQKPSERKGTQQWPWPRRVIEGAWYLS